MIKDFDKSHIDGAVIIEKLCYEEIYTTINFNFKVVNVFF